MPLGIYNSASFKNVAGDALVVASGNVEVRRESDGALASIFSDRAGASPITQAAYPSTSGFKAGANGDFQFYAAGISGGYQVRVYSDDLTLDKTLRYQATGTARELDADPVWASALAAAISATITSFLAAASQAAARVALGLSATPATPAKDGYGFIWSHGTDATNDFDISVGGCMDDAGGYWMTTAAALGKQADVAWAVGGTPAAPAGMLDVGAIANAEYYIWQIARSDTGVVDAICSLTGPRGGVVTMTIASPCVVTQAGHGKQAGAGVVFSTTGALPTGLVAGTRYYVIATGLTADAYQLAATQGGAAINTSGTQSGVHTGEGSPTLPASYDKKRVRGYFRRLAGVNTLLDVYETEGGGIEVAWRAPTLDVNQSNTLTNSRRTDPVKVPLNFSTVANLEVFFWDATTNCVGNICCPNETDVAVSLTRANLRSVLTREDISQKFIRTSDAGLVACRSDLATVDTYRISTIGFIWARRN